MADSTLSGNTAFGSSTTQGGALRNIGLASLTQCTFHNNTAPNGGAISHSNFVGPLILSHCTISGNTAFAATGKGGGLHNLGGSPSDVQIQNCILYGNSAADGPDIYNNKAIQFGPANIVGSLSTDVNGTSDGYTLAFAVNPLLARLGLYGGPTQTMPLKPGSSARNAATGSPITTDQRGKPIVGTPDLGAYEAGTVNLYGSWSWETLGTAPAPNGDPDGDQRTNFFEYATLSDPNTQNHEPIPLTTLNQTTGKFRITMKVRRSTEDLVYQIMRNPALSNPNGWTVVAIYNSTNGLLTYPNGSTAIATLDANDILTVDDDPGNAPSMFYQVKMLTTL